jgi:DNA-directed RNA polymerase specialized sigma24 family protein
LPIDKHRPFAGQVMVYGLPVHLDMSDGTGVEEILGRMSQFLDGFARWHRSDPAIEGTDMRQEAYAAALEGMCAYNADCRAQLSTFLHCHVRNRMMDLCRRARNCHAEPCIAFPSHKVGLEEVIDLDRELGSMDGRWSRIMKRIFVEEERIGDVAKDESMSPWGLTRALNRRLASTRCRLSR